MKKQKKASVFGRKIIKTGIVTMLTVMSLTSCSTPALSGDNGSRSEGNQGTQESSAERVDTGFMLTGPDSYDSADTPIVIDIDRDDNSVTFLNLQVMRKYTLSFDGTTKLYDKYGESISLEQIQIPERAAFLGKTLRELNWSQTFGVQLIEVRRKGGKLVNPSADFVLPQAGYRRPPQRAISSRKGFRFSKTPPPYAKLAFHPPTFANGVKRFRMSSSSTLPY